MIVKEAFLKKLKDFGLNTYESKIWIALLSRGVSTAGELSDIANVPRSRSYDVLESLEKKGFVIAKVGKPIKYLAVSPVEALERVEKKVKQDADVKTKALEDLKESDILSELKTLHENGVEAIEPSDLSGSIKGRSNLYDQLITMINGAEKSVVLFTTKNGIKRKLDILYNSFKKAKKRGVKIRFAIPSNSLTKAEMQLISDIGEVREIDKIVSRFIIVDGKELAFMIMHDEEVHPSYDVAIWINTPFFATALEQLFDLAWKEMKTIKVKN